MMSSKIMQHEAVRGLLEAYILGALDADESAALEDHLSSGCSECDAILQTLAGVPVSLAQSVPERAPLPHVKQRLLARTAAERIPKRLPPLWGRRYTGWSAAALATVLLVVIAFRAGSLMREIDNLRANMTEMEDVTSLLSAPGMQFIDLQGVEPNAQAFGKVVIDRDEGRGVVYMYRLPQTPEGMQYQFWVLREGVPTSAGVFTVAEDGSAVLKLTGLPSPDQIASISVTLEPAGGLPSPSGMMYLTGPTLR